MNYRSKSIGVFTTDRNLVVQSWDPWMVESTGIRESEAYGRTLSELFPDLSGRGLLARLRRVAEGRGVEVLAPAFHKYLIACPPRDPTSHFERMRQHVTVSPLRDRDIMTGIVVTIEDVTDRFDRERRLASDLDSNDEAVRLRAARTLADEDAPALLTDALGDTSWRVRRIAVEGVARAGGREVTRSLVEALRENHRDPALLNATLTALIRSRDDVVMSIVELLDSTDADVRTYASLALGLIDDARAIPALLRKLDDSDVNVRYHVIEALGRLGDRQSAPAIAAIAESGDFFLSFVALDALAAIGESSVAPQLMPLLNDEMLVSAAAACVGALGAEEVAVPLASLLKKDGAPVGIIAGALANVYSRMEEQFGEGALVADLVRSVASEQMAEALSAALPTASEEDQRGIATVLSWLPFAQVDQTLAALLDRDGVRRTVAERLSQRGVSAAPSIEEVARKSSDEVKQAAARALGRIGSAASVPALIDWLRESSEVAIAAAGALGAIGDRSAFAPLVAMMDHPEPTVRQAVVSALNSIGHPDMERWMAASLRAESPRVRESAARIAGYFGYGTCTRHIVELCDDGDETVRRSAVESLANYDERAAWLKIRDTLAHDSSASVRAAAARALGQSVSNESLDALVVATRDASLWVRYFAIRSLARRGRPHADALAALAELATRDPATPVRIAAIEALGTLGSPVMLAIVLPLARDTEVDVARAAIVSLGSFDVDVTAKPLMAALDGDRPALQHAALDALGRQSAQHAIGAIRAIARLTRDDELRRHAIAALGASRNQLAVDALVALAGDRRARDLAVGQIANLDEEQMPWLRAALAEANEGERCAVADALGRMKHPGAGSALSALLEDPSAAVRLAAARALGRLDLRGARGQLATLAGTDQSPAVRIAARDALTRG